MTEKEEKKKPSVSFCPDDSIISVSDTVTVVESRTGVQKNVGLLPFSIQVLTEKTEAGNCKPK